MSWILPLIQRFSFSKEYVTFCEQEIFKLFWWDYSLWKNFLKNYSGISKFNLSAWIFYSQGKTVILLNSLQEWLLGCVWSFSYAYTINQVLYILLLRIKEFRCLKNVIHQIDSKNEWLLLSASFTAKFGLVFVSTLENAFS